jgi:hypothetical protein
MIYEDYNRPFIARQIERFFLGHSKKQHTYGIMQFMSDHVLSDEESIRLAKQKIALDSQSIYKNRVSKDMTYPGVYVAELIAKRYNPGDPLYGERVGEVFSVVFDTFYPPYNEKKNIRLVSKTDSKQNK